ncbi:MerR-like DNA binding protein [Algoriphagus ratkowskyi]|uniref:MerR family transcriptional regulator n=1 Tax=Algoriphagus ratkowskyi TaxID=57028 RepID=A0A2W7R5B9_9BACT|nr:chaperone modulator CbpM [Algoriphagus ratkowskyi]PZX56073.1 MerR-like DNA binding protein [Algoriphagus ratkowskyi]TXD77122.1 MerR family transcriptional regulator [Algoriphagus ratkowskyi]
MAQQELILIETLCTHYEVEISFVDTLYSLGLIEIHTIEQVRFIPEENVGDLEKMIRIHQDLEVNPEGIDVILNLLSKVDDLKNELAETKSKLRRFELTHP